MDIRMISRGYHYLQHIHLDHHNAWRYRGKGRPAKAQELADTLKA
jgi:hypothetical protein